MFRGDGDKESDNHCGRGASCARFFSSNLQSEKIGGVERCRASAGQQSFTLRVCLTKKPAANFNVEAPISLNKLETIATTTDSP